MNKKYSGMGLALSIFLLSGLANGQQSPANAVPQATEPSHPNDPTRLEQKLDQVMAALNSVQHQLDESKQEIDALRGELREARTQLQGGSAEPAVAATTAAADLQQNVEQLQTQAEIVEAEVKQHDQTKVESASKYPVKLNGLVLFSSFLNDGAVDNIDLPVLAIPRNATTAHGSLAATFRQTIFGLEARGPMIWGARSAADFHVDFFGGFPYTDYTTTAGLIRMRTAHARLDWDHHSLIAALDVPLISPVQPTSFVGIGEPPFAWSGNLWIWAPQVESINRANLGAGKLGFDFALIDPAAPGNPAFSGQRQPNAGETSRQPGYESRMSYTLQLMDRPFTVGAGGYYSRQTYPGGQHVDAWAGTGDWSVPLTRRLDLSGELYRGRALAGLGGGTFKDYLTDPETGLIHGLNTEGGWSQLKFKMTRSLEANAAIGEDTGLLSELREYTNPIATDIYTDLARNRMVLANIIYRPKTYLLFSAEYRNIHSWPISGQLNTSQSLGIATGYSF
jgi:hypothetical protein